ncbi:hypothetical protein P3T36_004211 [Kitasatospora sp. MAP12-15]|uniref:hypothetical protein n=1 Tax=unclassified Kitasatospora TaxID=2633591 RepID=UPI0024770E98|nr:hypothetical protein [Kitasatospora sp. MAP12-44]MDH6108324.1 hypothetical protein [Kitasatospora sp. MAP12-44]
MSMRLARAVLEKLPPERLVPDELAGFDAHAAAWDERAAADVASREGVNGFGFDSITPEATELALMVAHAAMGVVIESGLHAWWRRLRRHPKQPAPLSSAQLLEIRSRVLSTVRRSGADAGTAELYADTVIEALKQGGEDGEAA